MIKVHDFPYYPIHSPQNSVLHCRIMGSAVESAVCCEVQLAVVYTEFITTVHSPLSNSHKYIICYFSVQFVASLCVNVISNVRTVHHVDVVQTAF